MMPLAAGSISAERRFGFTIAAALGIFAVLEMYKGADKLLCVALFAGSVGVAVIALGFPKSLRPLNAGWLRFGEILGRFVSPIVLSVIFFGLVTPLAIGFRLFGRDELHLRRRATGSYWIDRSAHSPSRDSFKHPF